LIGPDQEVSAINAAVNDEVGHGGAILRQGGTERRTTTMFAAPTWRTHSTGVLYLMVERMREYETVMLSQLHQSVPSLDIDVDVMPVMLMTMQTMLDMPGVKEVLRAWSNRLGMVVVSQSATRVRPPRVPPPNETPVAWDFTNQRLPETYLDFLSSISDNYRDAGMNAWAVEVVVLTLYFIQRASWSWEVLFGGNDEERSGALPVYMTDNV
jgi:hypothetical protein